MSPMKMKKRSHKRHKSDGVLGAFVGRVQKGDFTKVPRFCDKFRIFEKFCSVTDLPIDAHKTETYGRQQYAQIAKDTCKSGSAVTLYEDDIKSAVMTRAQ